MTFRGNQEEVSTDLTCQYYCPGVPEEIECEGQVSGSDVVGRMVPHDSDEDR